MVGNSVVSVYESRACRRARFQQEVRDREPVRDSDILDVAEVARLLRCGIDAARRIPRTELAAYQGPGKYLLYLRPDVLEYVKRRGGSDRTVHPVHRRREYVVKLAAPTPLLNLNDECRRLSAPG